MNRDHLSDEMRKLRTAAGLSEQHTCIACKKPLKAWSRQPSKDWSCPDCNVSNTTVAMLDQDVRS